MACGVESSSCEITGSENQYLKSGTERCRKVGFQSGSISAYLLWSQVFPWRVREICAAKTIFHLSGRKTRHWAVAVARCGWSGYCGSRGIVFFRAVRFLFGRTDTGRGSDHWRRVADGRISYANCGAADWDLFPRDCPFVVSRVRPVCA